MNMRILSKPLFLAAICGAAMVFAPVVHAAQTLAAPAGMQKATFAGGCFWCMEPPFEGKPGVIRVTSGYLGGDTVDPSYEEVSSGSSNHAEAVEIVFDPSRISYAELLEIYWRNIDPTVKNRQFCDVGSQYRSAIFVHDDAQRKAALQTKQAHVDSPRFAGTMIYTEVLASAPFYAAEDYHQDYATRNPKRYAYYRWNCGRDDRLKAVWGTAAGH